MKGQKAYSSATLINMQLYHYSTNLTELDKKELYWKYFALIKRSAYSGYAEGQYDFAQQFENMSFLGIKNPLYNPKKCIFWYTKASEQGHPEAFNNLAHLYELGAGCQQNLDLALDLYKRAAELGSPSGKKNFRIMLKSLSPGGWYNK
jgi:TPR repeat protein